MALLVNKLMLAVLPSCNQNSDELSELELVDETDTDLEDKLDAIYSEVEEIHDMFRGISDKSIPCMQFPMLLIQNNSQSWYIYRSTRLCLPIHHQQQSCGYTVYRI